METILIEGGILKYTQGRDEYGTTEQERLIAELLSQGVKQIEIARELQISRQRVGQLKDAVLKKNLILKNGIGYVISDYGAKVIYPTETPSYKHKVENVFEKDRLNQFDKKFVDIVNNVLLEDEIRHLEEEE